MTTALSKRSSFPVNAGTVTIDPDLREHFPDSETVNQALRSLLERKPPEEDPD